MTAIQHFLQILLVFVIAADDKNQATSMTYRRMWPLDIQRYNNGGCGNITSFGGTSGRITSPGYPGSYPHALDCDYTIEVAEKNSVNITFEDFLTEGYSDWVQIRCSNGTPYESARFSGRDIPPFMSFRSCRRITVQFHSDYSISHDGFSLNYSIGEVGLSGGIISRPRNFYSGGFPQDIVLSCESSISINGSYPWWSYKSGYEVRSVTNSMCELSTGFLRRFGVISTSKSRGSSSSTCNITLTIGSAYPWNSVTMFICTDSSLTTTSSLVVQFDFSVHTDRDDNGREIVKGDNIFIHCFHRLPSVFPTGHQINVSTYFSSAEQDFIPEARSSGPFSSAIIVNASSEVLPSYTCHFNFSFAGNFPAGMATNLPEDFALSSKHHEVLFWPEDETMTVIGAVNGKIDRDGMLTCHAPANPAPKYQWVDAASGKSSAGPSFHVLRSGNYTCVATSFIRHRIYNASKSVTIEISRPVTVKRGAASTVGVVLGVIGLIFIGIFVTAFVLLYRKITSLHDSISQSGNIGRVSCRLPGTNDNWGTRYSIYDERDKTILVAQ